MRRSIGIAAQALVAGAAQAYTLKQRSYRAHDGSVAFACVTAPFEGTITFVASERFPSGIAALVVPASNYPAFLRRRYPTPWYAAADTDLTSGNGFTRAARLFDRETHKVPTVMFQAEADRYGNFDQPHVPIDGPTLQENYAAAEAAITNCRLR